MGYLLFQTVLLIDFSYAWNEHWVERFENSRETQKWQFLLLFFTGVFLLLIFVFAVLSVICFPCPHAVVMSLVSLILCLFTIVTASSNYIEHGCNAHLAIFTSSFICCIISYLGFSGFTLHPECNPIEWVNASPLFMGVDLSIGIVAILYYSLRSME